MSFTEFENEYFKALEHLKSSIRKGQQLMSLLYDIWPEEYKRIIEREDGLTTIDCFYNNRLIPNTLKHLEKVWINYPN